MIEYSFHWCWNTFGFGWGYFKEDKSFILCLGFLNIIFEKVEE